MPHPNTIKDYEIKLEVLPVGKVSQLIPHGTSTPCQQVNRRESVRY
jgi:hypothetical protein